MSDKPSGQKGYSAEEAIASYFRDMGSFTVRGVPIRCQDKDVTDIDLWVYSRSSSHVRDISIVDIKNKKRAKPYERAIWVRGLQEALGADYAILASQGLTPEAKKFARKAGVKALSSSVFSAIVKRYSESSSRLSSEEVYKIWAASKLGQDTISSVVRNDLQELAEGISFRTLNILIDDAKLLLAASLDHERLSGPATRAFYYVCSLILISIDYLGSLEAFSDHTERASSFRNGLIFGRADEGQSQSMLNFAEAAATDFVDPSGATAAKIRSSIQKQIQHSPLGSLAEPFARFAGSVGYFRAALFLEREAFSNTPKTPRELENTEAKSLIGLICDYGSINRRDVLGVDAVKAEADNSAQSPPGQPQLF